MAMGEVDFKGRSGIAGNVHFLHADPGKHCGLPMEDLDA
jgi:hypothetical protein